MLISRRRLRAIWIQIGGDPHTMTAFFDTLQLSEMLCDLATGINSSKGDTKVV